MTRLEEFVEFVNSGLKQYTSLEKQETILRMAVPKLLQFGISDAKISSILEGWKKLVISTHQ